MAQLRGNAGYGIGQSGSFGGGQAHDESGEPNALDAIRKQTSKIEDLLDAYSEPIKP
jgi:ER-derived vesicles protein